MFVVLIATSISVTWQWDDAARTCCIVASTPWVLVHVVETLLSTVLGPAVVITSGWGWISVVPARHGGGMAMLGVVVVEREEVRGLFEM